LEVDGAVSIVALPILKQASLEILEIDGAASILPNRSVELSQKS